MSNYVDARLANAHDLVKQLPGPFDFVFSGCGQGLVQTILSGCLSELKAGGTSDHTQCGRCPGGDSHDKFVNIIATPYHEEFAIVLAELVLISYKKK
ncbi:MAG: hypothetical protein U5K54_05110 [Cytophagales bacterium]|nr:hypothetical protein [Cytophagales bacterium]